MPKLTFAIILEGGTVGHILVTDLSAGLYQLVNLRKSFVAAIKTWLGNQLLTNHRFVLTACFFLVILNLSNSHYGCVCKV